MPLLRNCFCGCQVVLALGLFRRWASWRSFIAHSYSFPARRAKIFPEAVFLSANVAGFGSF
jgi:hypothetical protein